jgi:hypothetical protein
LRRRWEHGIDIGHPFFGVLKNHGQNGDLSNKNGD